MCDKEWRRFGAQKYNLKRDEEEEEEEDSTITGPLPGYALDQILKGKISTSF